MKLNPLIILHARSAVIRSVKIYRSFLLGAETTCISAFRLLLISLIAANTSYGSPSSVMRFSINDISPDELRDWHCRARLQTRLVAGRLNGDRNGRVHKHHPNKTLFPKICPPALTTPPYTCQQELISPLGYVLEQ